MTGCLYPAIDTKGPSDLRLESVERASNGCERDAGASVGREAVIDRSSTCMDCPKIHYADIRDILDNPLRIPGCHSHNSRGDRSRTPRRGSGIHMDCNSLAAQERRPID